MSTNLDCITRFPREIRQEIFSNLSPKDLFGLGRVCKLFNGDLSNEFFQKRCYEMFQTLRLFPKFYAPILETIKTPWKFIYFALSDTRTTEELYSVAKRMAETFQSEFIAYSAKTKSLTLTEINKQRDDLQSISGAFYEDPNSKIHQAWQSYQKNWSKEDDEEYTNLHNLLVECKADPNKDPALLYWFKTFMKISTAPGITPTKILDTLIKRKADPRIIRYQELTIAANEAQSSYIKLEVKRKKLNELLRSKYNIVISYDKILQNPKKSKVFATETIYHILYLLANLKTWKDHLPILAQLPDDIDQLDMTAFEYDEIQEGVPIDQCREGVVNIIREKINSLPQDVSARIWKTLYDKCGNGVQEFQWSENHFDKHIPDLQDIISEVFKDLLLNYRGLFDKDSLIKNGQMNYDEFNVNPCQHSKYVKDCADFSETISMARENKNFSLEHVLVDSLRAVTAISLLLI